MTAAPVRRSKVVAERCEGSGEHAAALAPPNSPRTRSCCSASRRPDSSSSQLLPAPPRPASPRHANHPHGRVRIARKALVLTASQLADRLPRAVSNSKRLRSARNTGERGVVVGRKVDGQGRTVAQPRRSVSGRRPSDGILAAPPVGRLRRKEARTAAPPWSRRPSVVGDRYGAKQRHASPCQRLAFRVATRSRAQRRTPGRRPSRRWSSRRAVVSGLGGRARHALAGSLDAAIGGDVECDGEAVDG